MRPEVLHFQQDYRWCPSQRQHFGARVCHICNYIRNICAYVWLCTYIFFFYLFLVQIFPKEKRLSSLFLLSVTQKYLCPGLLGKYTHFICHQPHTFPQLTTVPLTPVNELDNRDILLLMVPIRGSACKNSLDWTEICR